MKKLTIGAPVLMAIVTIIAYAVLQPTGTDISNPKIVQTMQISGWAIGPMASMVSLLIIGILTIKAKILRLNNMHCTKVVIVLAALLPWLYVSWSISGEPRYTNIARGIIDFGARPLLWGSLIATVYTLFIGIFGTFFKHK